MNSNQLGSRHEACMFLLYLHKLENPSQSPSYLWGLHKETLQ